MYTVTFPGRNGKPVAAVVDGMHDAIELTRELQRPVRVVACHTGDDVTRTIDSLLDHSEAGNTTRDRSVDADCRPG